MSDRHPDEILKVLDTAQERLDALTPQYFAGEDINLRDLMWEVIEDVMDSYNKSFVASVAAAHPAHKIRNYLQNEFEAANVVVSDYLANHYGDD